MKLSRLTATASILTVLALVPVAAACDKPHHAAVAKTGTCLRAAAASGSTDQVSPGPSPAPTRSLDPNLALDCFDGSGPVRLAAMGTPTVVNLWASWCPPCREELPAIESFARHANGQVAVIGVDTQDTRSAAASTISDRGLTYPMLYDQDQRLLRELGLSSLPVTMFLDGRGAIVGVYHGPALDEAKLTGLAQRYFGAAG